MQVRMWDVFFARQAKQILDGGSFPEKEKEWLCRLVARGEAVMHQIIEANIPLVVACARGIVHGPVPEDYIQEGIVGLIAAVKNYDPRRGTKFSTYAYPWIRQAIQRAIGRDCTISLPVYLAEDWETIRKSIESCNGDIIAAAKMAAAQIAKRNTASAHKRAAALQRKGLLQSAVSISAPPLSLDQRWGDDDDDGVVLSACLPAPGATPEETALKQVVAEMVRDLVSSLPDKEQQLIRLRYFGGLSRSKCAQTMDISLADFRRIERSAFRNLLAAAKQCGLHEGIVA